MWVHLQSGKRYVGSSVDLRRRFLEYFNTERLLRSPSMIINRALLKYGYSAFRLEILEYCGKDKLMEKEKYYLDFINPE
jgi:group I intron endonuclease